MEFNLKTALRAVFLVALIYALAAMLGAVPGFGVRFGTRKGSCKRKPRPFWQYTGMVGELVQTSGNGLAPAGTPVLF